MGKEQASASAGRHRRGDRARKDGANRHRDRHRDKKESRKSGRAAARPPHELEKAKMLLQQAQSRERFAKLEVQRLEHHMDSPEVKAEISAAQAGVAKAQKSLELVNLNKQAMTRCARLSAGTILRRLAEPGIVAHSRPRRSPRSWTSSQKRVRARVRCQQAAGYQAGHAGGTHQPRAGQGPARRQS